MDNFSFTKADRLLDRKTFLQLQKTGKKIQNHYFIAIYAPGQVDRSRLGITVTRKVGSAVHRNRIKRISREYFRRNRHKLSKKLDINIVAKKQAALLSSIRVYTSLKDLFSRMMN